MLDICWLGMFMQNMNKKLQLNITPKKRYNHLTSNDTVKPTIENEIMFVVIQYFLQNTQLL